MTRRRTLPEPEVVRRITGPDELVQAVPYLLGFHPSRSLVLVGLRGGRLVVTARLDLDAADGAIDPRSVGLLTTTLARMGDGGATEIIVAVYADDEAAGGSGERAAPARALQIADVVADVVAEAVDVLPCRLGEVLLVVGDRWWSLTCESPDCCPPGGRPIPLAPSAFTAAATVEGVVPLADRAALEATLAPRPERADLAASLADAEHDAVAATLAAQADRRERSLKRALFAAARASVEARWSPPLDADACRFAIGLRGITLRDSLWLAVDERRIDGRPLWRDLARRLPAPYDAAPLFLFGWSSWRAGDGALARTGAERALDSDPDYTAADLLLGALARGLDPRSFPRLRRTA